MKIELEKAQNMLDWLKTKLFLDSIADKAKNRIVHRGEVYTYRQTFTLHGKDYSSI